MWVMWASSLPATAGAPRRRSSSRMVSVSPWRTRTTLVSMLRAAVICLSRSESCPVLARVALPGGVVAGACRGESPSRIRAWSGMPSPSAMRWNTWVAATARVPLMISLTRPWPSPTAVPMRIWLIPVYWHSSANSVPMSRLRRAWPTSGRYQKAGGIDGGSNALAHMAFLRGAEPATLVTGCDQQLTRHLTVRTPCVMGS